MPYKRPTSGLTLVTLAVVAWSVVAATVVVYSAVQEGYAAHVHTHCEAK